MQLIRLALVALLLAACANPGPDYVFVNGKVLTVDAQFSIAEAIAVCGNRIAAVGDSDTLRRLARDNTRVIDLGGRTIIPGLIDSHIHYLRGTKFAAYETRVDGVSTRREFLQRIAARAAELDPGQWIFFIGGWNEQQFTDRKGGFSREELDAVAPDNPVYIQKTYTAFYMNTPAIEAIAPKIGDLYTGSAAVHTSGRDGRRIMYAALEHFPFAETFAGRMEEIKAFNTQLNALGLTTVYDVGYLDGSYKPVAQLASSGELSLRVFYALRYWADSPRTALAAAELLERQDPFGSRTDRFGVFGIGEHVYGLLHDFTANPAPFKQEVWDSFEIIMTAAAKYGWPVNEHVMLDTTAKGMLDVTERINAKYPTRELRWMMGHLDLVSPESIARARDLGWVLAVHNHTAKPRFEGVASPDIRAIQDSGVIWGMGSDGTVVSGPNPFYTIWEYTAGKVFADIAKYEADEVITREQALIAHTRSNAYLLFMEDRIGTLETGKLADLVVLDRDYLAVPVDDIRNMRAVMTMMDGEIVFEATAR